MSAKQHVIAAALQLSEAERLEVAEALYESLAEPMDADVEQAWEAEIARRIVEIDSGKVGLIECLEARRRIAGDDAHAAH